MTPVPTRFTDITGAIVVAAIGLIITITMLPPAAPRSVILSSSFDDGKPYLWIMDGGYPLSGLRSRETDATKTYTEAFWKHLTERYPGVEPTYSNSEGQFALPGPAAENGWFERETTQLVQVEPEKYVNDFESGDYYPYGTLVYAREMISLRQPSSPDRSDEVNADGSLLVRFDQASPHEILDVWIVAPHTYTKGVDEPLGLTACAYDIPGFDETVCDVDKASGSDHENPWHVTGRTKLAEADLSHGKHGRERFVVLYRSDGSAVVVRNAVYIEDAKPGVTPTMSFSDLDELARAMPRKPL